MLSRYPVMCAVLIAIMAVSSVATTHADTGAIDGIVTYTPPDDKVLYGDWVRVLLVSDRFEPPSVGDLTALNQSDRVDRIISAHIDFFKRFREKMAQPGYLVAETLTTPDGTFRFTNVKPGLYYVVVTFPSMIRGYKVAWQVPVRVTPGQSPFVTLNNSNMAIPTYSRKTLQ